ncbi:MAG: hypothetical protein ACJA2E_000021 [Arenicella sp.]|jgi:hypothetical protein
MLTAELANYITVKIPLERIERFVNKPVKETRIEIEAELKKLKKENAELKAKL